MSTIKEFKVKSMNGFKINMEVFSNAAEVVEVSSHREITSGSFHNTRKKHLDKGWDGVDSFAEAEQLMKLGYQPTVDKMRELLRNAKFSGTGKRFKFNNEVAGFAPVVPLALQGVPNCMINGRMTPIKTKVLDVYYDCGAPSYMSSEEMIQAGQKLLGIILELEAQGYKFNLYAIGGQCDTNSADVLCVKIKSSNTPLDLKRMSFPISHSAFARVIKFDWYERFPKGKYRDSYGMSLGVRFNESELTEGFREVFGKKCVVFCCSRLVDNSEDHIREVIKNAGN